jgi:hypothetical protein
MNGLARNPRRLWVLVVTGTAIALACALVAAAPAGSAAKVSFGTSFTIPASGLNYTVNEGVHVVVTAVAVRGTQHTVRLSVGGPPAVEAGHSATADVCSNTAKTITGTATDVVEGTTSTFTITWAGSNIGPC